MLQELQPHDMRLVVAALTQDGAPAGLLERRGVDSARQLVAKALSEVVDAAD